MTQDYDIKDTFDLDGFLAACEAAGVHLSIPTPGIERDGYFTKVKDKLSVTLYAADEAKMAIVATKVAEFNQ
jgi:hypothetical protein